MSISLQARIDGMRDELVHHRADGYATTTDVLLLLELITEVLRLLELIAVVRGLDREAARQRVAGLLAAGERDTAINDEADRATDGRY